jgi:uncharacterized protein
VPENTNVRAVLDSNVLVSVFLAQGRALLSTELYRRCVLKGILYTAEEILEETREILLERERIRRRYTYQDEQVERFIVLVRRDSEVVESLPTVRAVERDPDDDVIVACAVAANADYIVSRDKDLLDLGEYQGIKIVSPEHFIQILRTI